MHVTIQKSSYFAKKNNQVIIFKVQYNFYSASSVQTIVLYADK